MTVDRSHGRVNGNIARAARRRPRADPLLRRCTLPMSTSANPSKGPPPPPPADRGPRSWRTSRSSPASRTRRSRACCTTARTCARTPASGCSRRCASSSTGRTRVARALVMGRSQTLGVVSFDTTLYGPASTLFGIERAAHDAGYFVSIISLRSLDRASVRERRRAAARPGRRRHRGDRAAGVGGARAAAPAGRRADRGGRGGPGGRRAAGRRRPDRRRPRRDASTCSTSATAPSGTSPGPSDWLEAQDRVDGWRSTLEDGGRRAAARAGRRLERALGLRAGPAARGERRR